MNKEAMKPFAEYFRAQEKKLADRGGMIVAMPEDRKLNGIPVWAWRQLAETYEASAS